MLVSQEAASSKQVIRASFGFFYLYSPISCVNQRMPHFACLLLLVTRIDRHWLRARNPFPLNLIIDHLVSWLTQLSMQTSHNKVNLRPSSPSYSSAPKYSPPLPQIPYKISHPLSRYHLTSSPRDHTSKKRAFTSFDSLIAPRHPRARDSDLDREGWELWCWGAGTRWRLYTCFHFARCSHLGQEMPGSARCWRREEGRGWWRSWYRSWMAWRSWSRD